MKILVAEDDAVSSRVISIALEKMGHEVRVATDGAEAWAFFQQDPVRVVISDWMMPEISGVEFCQRIRARGAGDYTYFIMVTARVGNENYQEAMEAGVDDFLTKPLNRQELLIRLRVAERILGFTREIREIRSLLPICSYCKRIRDDANYWQEIESYMRAHTATTFSHGICPSCFEQHIRPQLDGISPGPAAS